VIWMSNTESTVEYMLTTIDNPFDPFTQFDEWLTYDMQLGYNTSAFLARIANVSNDLSQLDQDQAIQDAINEIVQENISGMWKKVARGTVPTQPTD
jgi:hypothetical protein